MDEIESNYPRSVVDERLAKKQHLLSKVEFVDRLLVWGFCLSVACFDILNLTGVFRQNLTLMMLAAQLNGLLFLTIAIVAIYWINLVWDILIPSNPFKNLRSSSARTLLCMISPFTLHIPLIVLLGKIVRASKQEPAIFRWFSLAAVASSALSLPSELIPPGTLRQVMGVVSGVWNCATIVLGLLIMSAANHKISQLS